MRIKGTSLQQVLLVVALLAAVAWNLAHAAELKGVRLDTGATGTRAELQLDADAGYKLLTLSGAERLVVDLPGTELAKGVELPAGAGVVQRVRSEHPVPGTTRIVFDLSDRAATRRARREPGATGPMVVLEGPGEGRARPLATGAAPAPASVSVAASTSATDRLIAWLPPPQPVQPAPQPTRPQADPLAILTQGARSGAAASTPAQPPATQPAPQPATPAAPAQAPVKTVDDIARRAGMRPLIIAIDAGHGGQDPGARGPSGTREKDITLQIARRLAAKVNATPGLKAYLTRDTDVFIPLARRYQMARENKADLFVSIHADAFTKPSASGSS